MARSRSRLGLLASLATAVRAALRPGSPSLRDRAYAVPRLLRAALRGDYRQVTKGHLALLAGAVLYLLSPVDLVPEGLLGVIGLADDAVVLSWLVAALVNDTEGFLTWEDARDRADAPSQGDGRGDSQRRGQGQGQRRGQGQAQDRTTSRGWTGEGPQDARSTRDVTVPSHVVG